MSQFKAGEATVEITGDDKGLKRAEGRIGRTMKKIGSAMSSAALLGGAAFAGLSVWAIKLASDAEETTAKFDELFQSASAGAKEELAEFGKAAGRNHFELEKMASDIGALVAPMGFSRKEAADMSVKFTKLASDLASFNNIAESDALTALRSGIVGEAEPLRRLGVQLSAARIEQQAFTMGLIQHKKELNPVIKAQAAYEIIMQDTTIAQGDAIRTQGSFANQMRRFTGQIAELTTAFGTALLPIATKVLGFLTEKLGKLQERLGPGGLQQKVLEWAIVASEAFDAVRNTVHNVGEFIGNTLSNIWLVGKQVFENIEVFVGNVAEVGLKKSFDLIKEAWAAMWREMLVKALAILEQVKEATARKIIEATSSDEISEGDKKTIAMMRRLGNEEGARKFEANAESEKVRRLRIFDAEIEANAKRRAADILGAEKATDTAMVDMKEALLKGTRPIETFPAEFKDVWETSKVTGMLKDALGEVVKAGGGKGGGLKAEDTVRAESAAAAAKKVATKGASFAGLTDVFRSIQSKAFGSGDVPKKQLAVAKEQVKLTAREILEINGLKGPLVTMGDVLARMEPKLPTPAVG